LGGLRSIGQVAPLPRVASRGTMLLPVVVSRRRGLHTLPQVEMAVVLIQDFVAHSTSEKVLVLISIVLRETHLVVQELMLGC
jgi:hypothetical protein